MLKATLDEAQDTSGPESKQQQDGLPFRLVQKL